jgi:hypothetical protein
MSFFQRAMAKLAGAVILGPKVEQDAAIVEDVMAESHGPPSDPEDAAMANFSSESDAMLDSRVDPK